MLADILKNFASISSTYSDPIGSWNNFFDELQRRESICHDRRDKKTQSS
jgi:hypothetical protein